MHQPHPSLAIVRLTASDELLTAGITRGKLFYLVFDGQNQRFYVVWWDRIRWQCTCNQGQCTHKLAVNELVFEESQKRRITGDDLTAHLEDDTALNQ